MEPPPQPPIGEGKAIAEEMGVDQPTPRLILDRQLHAGDDPERVAFEAAKRINPRQCVVVGQRNGVEARRDMSVDHRVGFELAVAEDGVQVQVRAPVGYLSQCWQILRT